MRAYVAGPMRGIEDFNFPAFDGARDFLRRLGHTPISPADHDREMGYVTEVNGVVEVTDTFDIETVMRWDLAQVAGADAIVLLPGWETSTGVSHELAVARACGLKVYEVKPRVIPGHWYLAEEQPTLIVGMSGYAQSGKDTTGLVLTTEYGFERISFATPLYDMLYALDPPAICSPFTVNNADLFEWRAIAESRDWFPGTPVPVQTLVDAAGWEWAKKHTTVRQLLQRLGTEAGREILGDDIWVKTAMAKVKPGGRYVFTDVRYENEADAIRQMGGKIVRITRPGTEPVNQHGSETGMDNYDFDYTIYNNSDLPGLRDRIATFTVLAELEHP